MATFNQQGQTVQYQYNADVINFGEVKTPADFKRELNHLQNELAKAIKENAVEGEDAIDADMYIKKAILQSEKADPDKKTLLEYLASVKDLVSGVDGLAGAVGSAIAAVGMLF